MRVMKTTATAATLAYVERVLRYLASLRYFLDRVERLLAFVSRAERERCTSADLDFGTKDVGKGNNFFVLTRKCFSSLQYLLDICHHYSLNILELCVDAAQVPSGSAVHVCLLVFLDVRVWNNNFMKKSLTFFFFFKRRRTRQTVLPNSMKEYGRVTTGTFLPYWSKNSVWRSSRYAKAIFLGKDASQRSR